MSAPSARSWIIGSFAVTALHTAGGQRSQPTIGQLDHAVWSIRDGAPSYVSSLAQSADGVLWIGNTDGLFRFDGVRFEQFQAPPLLLAEMASGRAQRARSRSLYRPFGTSISTSVPVSGALETVSVAPIADARSRIPTIPQWPAGAASERSNPRPSSRTETSSVRSE